MSVYLEITGQIRNDLVNAYRGYYEEEMEEDPSKPTADLESEEAWIYAKILQHTPRERLAIYCEWNGILGYERTLYEIATGNVFLTPERGW